MKRRVLVVEDDDPIRHWVVNSLAAEGFDTAEAADGASGLNEARQAGVDLVILDLMLPRMDGFSVLGELRRTHPWLPVIIVTARDSEDDRVRGFHLGADDYVGKPFSGKELLARVHAVLRRSAERPHPIERISSGETAVNFGRREITRGDRERVPLSQIEVGILEWLASNAGRAVSREELLRQVWGPSSVDTETRALDMHVARLRQKLASMSADPTSEWIVTVRGKGYMLGPHIEIGKREEGRGMRV